MSTISWPGAPRQGARHALDIGQWCIIQHMAPSGICCIQVFHTRMTLPRLGPGADRTALSFAMRMSAIALSSKQMQTVPGKGRPISCLRTRKAGGRNNPAITAKARCAHSFGLSLLTSLHASSLGLSLRCRQYGGRCREIERSNQSQKRKNLFDGRSLPI